MGPTDTDVRRRLGEVGARVRAALERVVALDGRRPDPWGFVDAHWAAVVLVAATASLAYAARRLLRLLGPGQRPVLGDSVIFEYIGWHLSTGGRLYVDVWEIKPPLSFELLGVLAVLSGGDMLVYHVLAVGAACAAIVGGAFAAGGAVHEATGDGLAAVVAGLVPLVYPFFYVRALIGFKAKYVVICLGFLAIYLALRDRPALAGAAAAAVAWTWQMAVVFGVLAAGIRLQRVASGTRRADLARFAAGGAALSAVVLAPVLAWGALEAMVTETVLAPLIVTEEHSLASRVRTVVRLHRQARPVAVLGVVGLVVAGLGRFRRKAWWAPAGAAWFAFVLLFLDFDARPDLFPWLAFVGVGVGLLVGAGTGGARRGLAAAMALLVVLSVVTFGGYATGRPALTSVETYDAGTEMEIDQPYNRTERQYLYWNQVPPETCRLFAGATQYKLVKAMGKAEGQRYFEASCGELGPALDAVRRKYFG